MARSVNLNKAKDFVPQVRGDKNATVHANYKLLTRYFDQGKLLIKQAGRDHYEGLMRGLQTLCWFVLFQKNKSIRFNQIRSDAYAEEIPYNGVDDDCNEFTFDDDLDQDGLLLVDDCDDTNPDSTTGK